jgi:AraC-like DNA-binding protein
MNAQANEFHQQVAELIEEWLPLGKCSVSAIARRLRIDPGTLNRRLVRTGQGYLHLLQATRKRRAERLLTSEPLCDIARELGFGHPASFARWFRNTFGYSVRLWRQSRSGSSECSAKTDSEPGVSVL